VLLLHGIGSSSASFRYQLAALSDAFTLVAWDAPGYGDSADLRRPLGMAGYADAALALLAALELRQAHVVGVSWGGVVATRMALRHPDHVLSLALIGSTAGRAANSAAQAGLSERVEEIERAGARAYARQRAAEVVSADAPSGLIGEIEGIMASVRAAGYRSAAQSLAATDHRADLRRIRAPTAVLVGDSDRITGFDESRALAEGIAGARLVVIPAAGHLANQERPEAVNAQLRMHWSRGGENHEVS
jgi:3-oxoadipate enol-lactonase